MSIRFVIPPSVGTIRATARGELLERSLSRELGEHVIVQVASDSASDRSPSSLCMAMEAERLEPTSIERYDAIKDVL